MAVREGRFIVLPLIADDLGLSATEVGGLVTVSTAADLLLFPLAGFLMDRFGRLSAMVPAFSLVILGLVMLAVADSSLAVVMSGIVMGIGNGLGSGTMLTLGSDLAPADAAGPFLAGMSLMQGAGRIVGALLVGLVGDTLGLGAAAMAFAIVMGIAIVWLVGVIGESSDPERIRLRSLRVVEPSCVGKSGGK
jgi:MFS family permease